MGTTAEDEITVTAGASFARRLEQLRQAWGLDSDAAVIERLIERRIERTACQLAGTRQGPRLVVDNTRPATDHHHHHAHDNTEPSHAPDRAAAARVIRIRPEKDGTPDVNQPIRWPAQGAQQRHGDRQHQAVSG